MATGSITILDGGMGRELEKRGAPFRQPEWSALALMADSGVVKDVHKTFIAAGASVITTNSYALVPFHLGEKRFDDLGRALAMTAGTAARDAVRESGASVRVAGSIPPLFGSYRPDLYRADRVDAIAAPLIEGLRAQVDVWLCETQSLIEEPIRIKSLVDRLDTQRKPFWVAFTLEDDAASGESRLRSGESVADAVGAMVDVGVDAILFNCCQPEVIGQALRDTRQQLASLGAEHIGIGAYANAFAPQPEDIPANEGLSEMRADMTPSAYLQWARQWVAEGATMIGGCCGIGPEHIAALSEQLG